MAYLNVSLAVCCGLFPGIRPLALILIERINLFEFRFSVGTRGSNQNRLIAEIVDASTFRELHYSGRQFLVSPETHNLSLRLHALAAGLAYSSLAKQTASMLWSSGSRTNAP